MRKFFAILMSYLTLAVPMWAQSGSPARNDLPNSSPEVQTYVAGAVGDTLSKALGSMTAANAGVITDTSDAPFKAADVGKAIAISLAPYHAPTLIAPTITNVAASIAGPAEFHYKTYCTNSTGTQRGDESYESAKFMSNASNQVVITSPSTCDNSATSYVVYVSADAATDWPGRTSGKEVLAIGGANCGNGAPITLGTSCTLNALPTFTPWAASTVYGTKAQVIDSNGNLEWTSAGLTSGGSQPAWNATVGGTTSDNGGTWVNLGLAVVQFDFWRVKHQVSVGDHLKDSNGNMEIATVGGITGVTVPSWPITQLATVSDGAVTWEMVGSAPITSTNWAFGTISAFNSTSSVNVTLTCSPAGVYCPSGSLPSYALSNNDFSWGTDDTTAIQNACNAIDAASGGTLIIPPGVYWINNSGVTCGNAGKKNFITMLGAGGAGTPLIGIDPAETRTGVSEFVQFGIGANPMFTFGVGGSTQTFAGPHLKDLAFRDGTSSTRAAGSSGGSLGLAALVLKNETDFEMEGLSFTDWDRGIAIHFDAGQPGQWSQWGTMVNVRMVNVEFGTLWDDGRTSNVKMLGVNGVSSQLGGGVCMDFESGGGTPTYFGGGGNDRIVGTECNYFPLAVHQTDLNVMDWTSLHAEQTGTKQPTISGSNATGTGVLIEGTVAGGAKCQGNKFIQGSLTGFLTGIQIGLSTSINQYCQQTVIMPSNSSNTTNVQDYSSYTTGGGSPLGGYDTQILNDVFLQYQKTLLGTVDGITFASQFCTTPGTYDDSCISNAITYMTTTAGGSNVLVIDGGRNYAVSHQLVIGNCSTGQPITALISPGTQLTVSTTGAVDAIQVGEGSSIGGWFGQNSSGATVRPPRIVLASTAAIGYIINSCHNDGTQNGFGVHDLQISGNASATMTGGINFQGVGSGSYARNIDLISILGNPLIAQAVSATSLKPTNGILWQNIKVSGGASGSIIPVQIVAVNSSGSIVNAGVSNLTAMNMLVSGAGSAVCTVAITGNSANAGSNSANYNIQFIDTDIEVPNTNNNGVCVQDSHDIKFDTLSCGPSGGNSGTDCFKITNSLGTSANIQLTNGNHQSWTHLINDAVNSLTYAEPHTDYYPYGGVATLHTAPAYKFSNTLPTANVTNGEMIWCPDCTPASHPCTGSSTGTYAIRANGAWYCL